MKERTRLCESTSSVGSKMCGKPYALAKMNMISTAHRMTKNQNVLPRTEQHVSCTLFQLFRWGLSSSTSMLGSGRAVLGFVAISFTVTSPVQRGVVIGR